MKKRFLAIIPATALATCLMLFGGISHASNDGGLATLRGAPVSTVDKTITGDGMKKPLDAVQMDRNFTDQPPLVNHEVDKYPITKSVNKCLDCHSLENYKKEKATKIPTTHFVGADGRTLSTPSSRRHFCLQCHVPQIDTKPLVENTFQRAK